MRDTVAEMAERAQLISQEAGSKVSAAMKDVISAAAGLAGFAIESARDLVQYMVRRGQMTQEEADKLIRQAEDAHGLRPASEKGRPTASKIAADKALIDRAARDAANAAAMLNAPLQRAGAFSMRTGGSRPVAAPAILPAAPTKADLKVARGKAPTNPAPKASARSAAKPATKIPAKPAPKTATKSAKSAKSAKSVGKAHSKSPTKAKNASKASSKGSTSKPGGKSASRTKAGPKATAKKPAGKSAKAPAKKRR